MPRILIRLSLIFLILIGANDAVRSQTLEQSETLPNPDMPSGETPEEKPQERKRRRSIGIGGNIGLSGDTGLSEGAFALLNKNDLNDRLSIRIVSVFTNNRNDNSIALTANFPVRSPDGKVRVVPFVGGGALISSKSGFEDLIIRGLVTGGIDVPLSSRFTATTSVNVGFTDTANIGMQLGLTYSF
jgi:hypothetical protein